MVSATGNRHSREKASHLLKKQNQFKMKTKIKILIVSCVIAAAAFTGINMAQNNQSTGMTLADIAVMAKADGESGGGEGSTCLLSGGSIWAWTYACSDPGYPTLPKYQCSGTMILRSGSSIRECWL